MATVRNNYSITEAWPASGAVLPGGSSTFAWAAALGATQYQVLLGSSNGASNYYSANVGGSTSATATLPTGNYTLAAPLGTLTGGNWQWTYTQYQVDSRAQFSIPVLTPGQGSINVPMNNLPVTQVLTFEQGPGYASPQTIQNCYSDDAAFTVRIVSATPATLTLQYTATALAIPQLEPIGCVCPGGPGPSPPPPRPVPPPTPNLKVTSGGVNVPQATQPITQQPACSQLGASQSLLISGANPPAMPPLQAQIVMSDGSTPAGTAIFSISGSFPQSNFNTNYPPNGVFQIPWYYWNGLPNVGQPTPQAANAPWVAGWSAPVGGGNASILWSYNGVQGTPYNFCILGTNPDQSAVTAILAPPNSPNWYEFWFANYIAIHETDQSQFCDIFDPSRTNGGPYCGQNGYGSQQSGPYPGMPIWGNPFGYGVMQVDPPPSLYTLWNWSQNLTDGYVQLQTKAGGVTDVAPQGANNASAYAFWNGQIQQWNAENLKRQALSPPQGPFPPPESVDPGPNFSNNCHFIGSLSPASGISTPNTGVANTYWYGDAILMRMNAGTIDACGNNENYVSWINSTPTVPGYWFFDKTTKVNSDIVYEFCACTSFQACVRLPAPTCQQ